MLLLAQEAIPGGFEVATVDHGLRPEAKDECALVVAACEERGVPCEVLTVEVGEGNLQAKAREARYAALFKWLARRKLHAIATAHHADDQAETLLMRLNRGSGLSGLSGIREFHVEDFSGVASFIFMRVFRPLLGLRRAELHDIVDHSEVSYALDPSNDDRTFDRVKMRDNLRQCDWLDPMALAQSAGLLAEAERFVEDQTIKFCSERISNVDDTVEFRPGFGAFENVEAVTRLFKTQRKQVSRSEIAALVSRLESAENASLAGILARPKKNEDGKRVWVFADEPPRRTD